MTRKDYLLIAKVFRESYADAISKHFARSDEYKEGKQAGVLLSAFLAADEFELDNPRFDRAHFLAVVRGEKELTSKPQSLRANWRDGKGIVEQPVKMASCIANGCGMPFDSAKAIEEEQGRNPETLRPFWMRYCPKHRVTRKLCPVIVEKIR